jgi:hypothetical protein
MDEFIWITGAVLVVAGLVTIIRRLRIELGIILILAGELMVIINVLLQGGAGTPLPSSAQRAGSVEIAALASGSRAHDLLTPDDLNSGSHTVGGLARDGDGEADPAISALVAVSEHPVGDGDEGGDGHPGRDPADEEALGEHGTVTALQAVQRTPASGTPAMVNVAGAQKPSPTKHF